MRRRLRRNQNYLVIIGTGVIVFGLWSVIKTLMLLVLGTQGVSGYFDSVSSSGMPMEMSYLLLMLLLSADLLVRLYVGVSARAEGFGAKKGNVYVVFAVLLCLFHLAVIVMGVASRFRYYDSPEDAAVSFLMDLTSLVTLVELVNSIVKVRWLQRELTLSERA